MLPSPKRPVLAKITFVARKLPASCSPHVPKGYPGRSRRAPLLPEAAQIGRCFAQLGQAWARITPQCGQSWPGRCGQLFAESGKMWPRTGNVGRTWVDVRLPGQRFGNFRIGAWQPLDDIGARRDRRGNVCGGVWRATLRLLSDSSCHNRPLRDATIINRVRAPGEPPYPSIADQPPVRTVARILCVSL